MTAEKEISLVVALGRAVMASRAEVGVSRKELAERANISYPFLAEIENGTKTASISTLYSLAKALNARASYLLSRAEQLQKHANKAGL